MKLRNLLIGAAGLAAAAGLASTASASGYYSHGHYYHTARNEWQRQHPLRVEVNHRIQHLGRSITEERREGQISAYRAHMLREHVRSLKAQERRVASRNGSHIGYAEQARLNREENNLRHHIPS
jgi:hypothetical protein